MQEIKCNYLENGLKIIMSEDKSNPLVSVQLYIRMGSNWENENQAGYSHLMEHLVFKSTVKFPSNEIMEQASFLGGQINAYTEYDSTCFYITLPKEFLEEGIEIISELAKEANFSDDDFFYEKQVVIEELKQYQNDPEDFFIDEIPTYYFSKNPYKNPIIGTKESLNKAKPEDLREFYKTYYNPKNSFLVVTGDFDSDILEEKLKGYFNQWQPITIPEKKIVTEDFLTPSTVKQMIKKVDTNLLAFVIPELSERNPDCHALSMLLKIFAVGKSSRLYKKLFVKESLVDSIRVHSLCGIHDGCSIIQIAPKKNADIYQITEIFMDEFDFLRNAGVTSDELELQRREHLFSYKYTNEYIEPFGMTLGSEEILSDYTNFLKYPDMIKAVTEKDISRMIERFFQPELIHAYYLGNKTLDDNRILNILKSKTKAIFNTNKDTEYTENILESGIKLNMKRVIGKDTVGIAISLPVSQLNEDSSLRGVNLLTSTLLLYGNSKRNHEQFIQYCNHHGISISAVSNFESTTIRMKCFRENLFIALEILADALFSPVFPDEFVQNIKNTLSSSLSRMKDYPHYWAQYLWKQMIFGSKSNLLSKEGTKQDLRNISRKKIVNWYEKYYKTDKMILTVVGDFDFSKTIYICNRVFNIRKESQEKFSPNFIYKSNDIKIKSKNVDSDQAIVQIGGFGPSKKNKIKQSGFHVMSQIIGGDINSRLFAELREKRGLAYSVGFDYRALSQLGYFCTYAIVDKNEKKKSIKIIKEIFENIKENGVTDKEFLTAKNYIKGQRIHDEESVTAQAHTISVLNVLGYDYDYYCDWETRLNSVKQDSFKDLAKDYFVEDNFFIHLFS